MAIEMRLGALPEPARAQLLHMGVEVRAGQGEHWSVPRADWAALCRAMLRHAAPPGSETWSAFLPLRVASLPGTLMIPGDAPLMMRPTDKAWTAGPAPDLRAVGAARVLAAARAAAERWSEAEPGARRAIDAIAAAAEAVEARGVVSVGGESETLLAGAVGDPIDALLAELSAYLDMSTGNGRYAPIPGLDGFGWRSLPAAERRRLHDGLVALKGSDGEKHKQIVATLTDPIAATLDRPDPVDMSRLDRALPAYATLPWFAALRAGELRDAIVKFIEREVPSGAKDPLAFAALRVVTQWPGAAPWFVTFDWKETPRPPAGATRLATPGDDELYTTLTGDMLAALLAEGLITKA